MPRKTNDKGQNWDFDSMVSAKEVATTGVRGKLREMQRVCEDCSKTVPTATVKFAELEREGVELKRKNASLSDQNTNIEVEFLKVCAAKRTMHGQLKSAERQTIALKTHLADAKLAHGKLVDKLSKTEADLRAQTVSVEQLFSAEKTNVEYWRSRRGNSY